MNIQEAIKGIQQNGEAMRRVSWRTTRLTIKEYEDTNYRTLGSVTRATLLDERYGVWKPTVSDLTADDWEVCAKTDDPVADNYLMEDERQQYKKERQYEKANEKNRRLNIIALITAGAALLINAARAVFGF
nr:MAG TPA: Protein of unknown function (DUF2829) [Caudoviricetes sp.]